MFCHGPIPILLRHRQALVYRKIFCKLTTEVGILGLRLCQLTFQMTQVIHLLHGIADCS